MTAQKRLDISLLLCRLGAAFVFFMWTYDKLKLGFGLPGTGAGQMIARDYYYLDLHTSIFAFIGAAHMAVLVAFLCGLFKKPVRGYVIVLCLLPFLLPNFWYGLYAAIFVVPHPTITFYSGVTLCACAYAVFILRDYDGLFSLGSKKTADFSDPAFLKQLGLALLFCRIAVFIVYVVWVRSKLGWPEAGVRRMESFWLMPSFPAWGVLAFSWAELVICFMFLFGYFKRWTAAFFVFLGIMAVATPRALAGMHRALMEETWHTILHACGYTLLVCAIVVYLLRDYDTLFTLNKTDVKN